MTLASAATVAIGAAASDNVTISGTTAITAFDTVAAGIRRFVTFSGILTLTHNATSLILPGAANISTAANDTAVMLSLGSGNWQCIAYQKAAGTGGGTGSGAWTKLQTKTASSSAYLDFTGLTGYTKYALVFENLVPASSGSYLIALAGYGASPTYVTSGYANSYGYVTSSGGTGGVTSAATTGAIVGGGQGGMPASTPGTSGQFVAFIGSSTVVQVMGESVAGTAERGSFLSAVNLGATCTAIKLQVASGALITSGTATLYGIN